MKTIKKALITLLGIIVWVVVFPLLVILWLFASSILATMEQLADSEVMYWHERFIYYWRVLF